MPGLAWGQPSGFLTFTRSVLCNTQLYVTGAGKGWGRAVLERTKLGGGAPGFLIHQEAGGIQQTQASSVQQVVALGRVPQDPEALTGSQTAWVWMVALLF